MNRPVKSDSANDRFSITTADKGMVAITSNVSCRIRGNARQNLTEVHLEKLTVLAYYLKDLEKRNKVDEFIEKITFLKKFFF